MGILRKADDGRKRLLLDESDEHGDFLEVRTDLSKRIFNQLMLAMPNRAISDETGLTPAEGMEFARALFGTLVTGWSLDEEPTVEEYDGLSAAAASAVDSALVDHFSSLTPSADEQEKASPSPGRKPRVGTSKG